MIGRWTRPLWRLQGQLTLSYVVVTVVAVLTLIGATAAVTALSLRAKASSDGTAGAFVDKAVVLSAESSVAPFLVPYLELGPQDVQGLHDQLTGLTQPNPTKAKAQTYSAYASPAGAPSSVVVLAPNNVALAWAGVGQNALGQMLANAQVQSAVRDAWTGDADSERMAAHLPDGRTAAAVPLIDYRGHILGVVLAAYPRASVAAAAAAARSSQLQVVGNVLDQIVPSALLFGLGASGLGILTGVVFSRRLTRRLKRITAAAHCWSAGAFQVTVADTSEDEIGMLAGDLNAMAAQLQQLVTTRQELAVVEERHRLARDLHDSVKQQLFVMTMLIGAARSQVQAVPGAVQTLREAEQIATQAHQELTAMIHALRPVGLADKAFAAALRELVASWKRSTGIGAVVAAADEVPLAPDLEQALFQVVREALANVARHSAARSVAIALRADSGAVTLSIEDDGHGFTLPPGADGPGLGLTSMRERLEAVGGSLCIESGATGTCVEARCPLAAKAAPLEAERALA